MQQLILVLYMYTIIATRAHSAAARPSSMRESASRVINAEG